jgi:hypothetical protein
MFSKIKLDGGSIMAVIGSTSDKMYLCQVPNFGVLNDKAEIGRVMMRTSTPTRAHLHQQHLLQPRHHLPQSRRHPFHLGQ